jgi:hypothetical protein
MLGFEPEKIWDLYPFNHSLQYCCNLLFASTGIESKSFDASFDVKVTITSSNLLSPLVSGITVRWEIGCFTLRKINYNLVFAIYRNKLINSYNIKNNYIVNLMKQINKISLKPLK